MSDDTHAVDDKNDPPTNDGNWIPRERLNRVIDKVNDLQTQLDTALQAPKEPDVSREELLDKVNLGEMTQAQADGIWEGQITGRVTQNLQNQLVNTISENRANDTIQAYQEAIPELLEDGSPLNIKLFSTYESFRGFGLPNDAGTMLSAIHATVGPLETARTHKKGKAKVEAHQEGGSGGEGKVEGRQSKLTDRQRNYYNGAIRAGAYKDWDEVFDLLGIDA